MSFMIILLVGLLEGLIAYPLIHGDGWGKKGDILIAMMGALLGTIVYHLLDFPLQNDWGVIFTSMMGATLFLFPLNFLFHPETRTVKRRTT